MMNDYAWIHVIGIIRSVCTCMIIHRMMNGAK